MKFGENTVRLIRAGSHIYLTKSFLSLDLLFVHCKLSEF